MIKVSKCGAHSPSKWRNWKQKVLNGTNILLYYHQVYLVSLRPRVELATDSVVFFVLALSFLGFTILCFLLKLFGQIYTDRKALSKYLDESSKAIKNGKILPNVQVDQPKIFIAFEYIGYFSFLTSVLLLTVYLWFVYF